MKKIIFVLMAVATSYAFVACSSDDDKGPNCLKLIENAMNASDAYETDPTEANQQAYEAAMEALDKAGCTIDIEIE